MEELKEWFILGACFHGDRGQFEDNFGTPSEDEDVEAFAKRTLETSYIKLICTEEDFMKISRVLFP